MILPSPLRSNIWKTRLSSWGSIGGEIVVMSLEEEEEGGGGVVVDRNQEGERMARTFLGTRNRRNGCRRL